MVGLCDASQLSTSTEAIGVATTLPDERPFDRYQGECIAKAMATPHFAVIQGPPGSGKTTVITGIVRRALARGERVLVVSPTHVAVDNVVEKLVPGADAAVADRLAPSSLPVRFSARPKKLSERALEYWVGSKKERRGATISRRVQARLAAAVPFAAKLYEMEDTCAAGYAPISAAVSRVESVICGTPIGILSYDAVRKAEPGSFGLLIVDEVSKMTMPEFLAVAVKARRWVLVGDPAQLPPFLNAEECATTLDDVLDPSTELVCSVSALAGAAKQSGKRTDSLVVVSSRPEQVARGIVAHMGHVAPQCRPRVALLDDEKRCDILVCKPADLDRACELQSPMYGRDRTRDPEAQGSVRILVERGIQVARPKVASGRRFVEPKDRAQTVIFEKAFNLYHALPWSARSRQKLRLVEQGGADGCLPSLHGVAALSSSMGDLPGHRARHVSLIDGIAMRYALNAVSVYDWLTGIPAECFETSPLRELNALTSPALLEAVQPFVGTLKKQYRMHRSLSRVPRRLFYFDEALLDGRGHDAPGCLVDLVQVEGDGVEREANAREVERIRALLEMVNRSEAANEERPKIMVITPYKRQEERLQEALTTPDARVALQNLDVEVCTLDRCQGREADYVLISLVKDRATPFLDMPKRWNVALTRAMKGLFIVGNVEAFLREARGARSSGAPAISLLARIIDAYACQIREERNPQLQGAAQ